MSFLKDDVVGRSGRAHDLHAEGPRFIPCHLQIWQRKMATHNPREHNPNTNSTELEELLA